MAGRARQRGHGWQERSRRGIFFRYVPNEGQPVRKDTHREGRGSTRPQAGGIQGGIGKVRSRSRVGQQPKKGSRGQGASRGGRPQNAGLSDSMLLFPAGTSGST